VISLDVLIGSAEEQRLDHVDAAAARNQSAESFARADLPDSKLMVFLQTTKVQREEQTHGIDGLLNHGLDSLFKKSVYTVYEIKCRKHHREWSVFRRYSQFQDLCAKVQLMGKTQRRRTLTAHSAEFEQELRDACAEIVKELPKKKVWDRLAPNVVELRRIGLQVRQATPCTDSQSTLGRLNNWRGSQWASWSVFSLSRAELDAPLHREGVGAAAARRPAVLAGRGVP
jgi:hypothetical protein